MDYHRKPIVTNKLDACRFAGSNLHINTSLVNFQVTFEFCGNLYPRVRMTR